MNETPLKAEVIEEMNGDFEMANPPIKIRNQLAHIENSLPSI